MAAYWEKIVHCVVERVGHGPVYKVQPQTGNRFSVCVTETYLLGITEKTREKTQAQPKKKTLTEQNPMLQIGKASPARTCRGCCRILKTSLIFMQQPENSFFLSDRRLRELRTGRRYTMCQFLSRNALINWKTWMLEV